MYPLAPASLRLFEGKDCTHTHLLTVVAKRSGHMYSTSIESARNLRTIIRLLVENVNIIVPSDCFFALII